MGVSVGGANVLFESLKALVVKNPLALSVVKSECKIPLDEGDERGEAKVWFNACDVDDDFATVSQK